MGCGASSEAKAGAPEAAGSGGPGSGVGQGDTLQGGSAPSGLRQTQGQRWNGGVLAVPWEGPKAPVLTLFHFNDVYNIESRAQEPVGGAARFVTVVRDAVAAAEGGEGHVLFSGDAFNPSMMSVATRGKHMPPVLNRMGIECACIGNHDFDFGVDMLEGLMGSTTFPWLLSNVFDKANNEELAGGLSTVQVVWGGRKVGLVGLVEKEWLVTLATVDEGDVEYEDFVECGTRLAAELRDAGCELVIALTHMREPNDHRLAWEAKGIDLILGGHDHHYAVEQVNGIWVCKSGTDFRELTQLVIRFDDSGGGFEVTPTRLEVTSSAPEDPETKAIVDEFLGIQAAQMEVVIGRTAVPLDGRFTTVRTKESNLGNLVTDAMRDATGADVALLNSGTLRSDVVHGPGPMRVADLVAILPMADPMVVLEMDAAQLREALENGVSQYPRLEGRFPQLSGVSLGYKPSGEPGQRVQWAMVGGRPLDEASALALADTPGDSQDLAAWPSHARFKVVTKAYLAQGKDGYDVLKTCPVLVDGEDNPIIPAVLRNLFTKMQIANHLVPAPARQDALSRGVKAFKGLIRKFQDDDGELRYAVNAKVEGRIVNLEGEGEGDADA